MAEKLQNLKNPFDGGRCKKRSRSTVRANAAVKEKKRLKAFNEALKNLQSVIPVKLPEGRKLHKKQTLQFACRYIQFLHGCLDGSRDWSKRSRFWCESDEDYSMIDAIDAAANAVSSVSTKHAEARPRKKESSCDPLKLEDTFFSNRCTLVGKNETESLESDNGYWMMTQQSKMKYLSSSNNFLRFQYPMVSMTSNLYHLDKRPDHNYEISEERRMPSHILEYSSVEAVELNHQSLSQNNVKFYRPQEFTTAISTDSFNHHDAATHACDQLDKEWSDLRDILFK